MGKTTKKLDSEKKKIFYPKNEKSKFCKAVGFQQN
jgi:hypothetical protein